METSNSTISGNNITANNRFGILFGSSSGNNVSGNTITANNYYGIYLDSSSNNNISGNIITNNEYGIYLGYSSNYNSISGNNITANNDYGIILYFSSNYNSIFHDNFVNNNVQVHSGSDSANIWDNGYPSGGNYWSDYNGTDLYCGLGQNETGSDGIGDTPYIIDGSNVDHYPSVNPLAIPPTTLAGDVNGDGNVSLADLTLLASAYSSKLGDANWNPMADLAAPYGIISLTDVVTLAMHYGEHYP